MGCGKTELSACVCLRGGEWVGVVYALELLCYEIGFHHEREREGRRWGTGERIAGTGVVFDD